MEHIATPAWAMLAYLASGVLFILALRGLSSPSTSQRGNRFGLVGMAIAVVTTLLTHSFATLPEIAGAITIGGAIGWITARRIKMTDMPQLVAAFHSLVGLAAVLVGWAAYLNPQALESPVPTASSRRKAASRWVWASPSAEQSAGSLPSASR